MEWRLVGLLVVCSWAAVSSVFTARGFFCRDPDTGKLYPANTTWPSTTFCGSYTCRLRKKISTEEPLRQFNITTTEMSTPQEKSLNCTPTTTVIIEEKSVDEMEHARNVDPNSLKQTGDRYLTEDEIKAMTFLLQTVKKSDLEAILEVYNLAQDIYKEVDKVPDVNLIQEVLREEKNKQAAKVMKNGKSNKFVSYWYEPLTLNSNKHKAEVTVPIVEDKVEGIPVSKAKEPEIPNIMYFENSNMINPAIANEIAPPKVKSITNPQVLVRESFNKNDFGKLPYYYPMSKFQRESSYVHQNEEFVQPAANEDNNAQSAPQVGSYPQSDLIPPTGTYQLAEMNPQSMSYPQLENFLKTGNPQYLADANQYPNSYAQQGNTFSQTQQSNSLYLQPGDVFPQAGPAYPQNINAFSQMGNAYPQGSSVYTQELCPENSFQNMGMPNPVKNAKPCKPLEPVKKVSVPWHRILNKQYNVDLNNKMYQMPKKKPPTFVDPKANSQNMNFPFAYVQYNLSALPKSYFADSNTWSILNLYNKHHRHPYLRAAYVAHIPHSIFVDPGTPEEVQNEAQMPMSIPAQKALESRKGNLMPEWQTEPLSISVLNEVKANLEDQKLLPYPFRRKIKLEKVGKIYKMDEANRNKRNVNDEKPVISPDEFEVYIEKSTCQTDTEPGFFRIGNASEPFPACCPQRIINS